ncbi:ribosomal protein S18-alanine N-acetyltransferase [Ferrovum sp.]|uniref:ribosomal protein S18-alanine N-acetyltransferase n=1 Tax=Ferrovum sp. TaxID=2609467 RepID=UPI0026116B9B|nr:ribosomal protein S18-alanine N-acetyltransferase [Ferrovum sp.]
MNAPSLRPLTPPDVDVLCAIEKRNFSAPWTRRQLLESLSQHQGLGMVPPSGTLFGYTFFMQVFQEIHLLNLVIDQPWQRQGWGRILLDEVITRARVQGAECLLLEVRPSNEAALRLYRSAHFQPIGTRRGYYANPTGQREDALVLRRVLTP